MSNAIIIQVVLALSFAAGSTLGCKCALGPPGDSAAIKRAESAAGGADAIFEGMVESVQLKWALIEAKVGDLMPVDFHTEPYVVAMLSVLRSYRGAKQARIQVRTGLGSGDCGFRFEPAKEYLVYGFKNEPGEQLSTSICSGTALLEDSQANLAYLNGRPIPSEVDGKRKGIEPGKLCIQIKGTTTESTSSGEVMLFRAGYDLSIPTNRAEPDSDGLYCATNVAPGKYRLLFASGDDAGRGRSFSFLV